MRRSTLAVGFSVAFLLVGCSANDATSNVANMDGPARQACGDLKEVVQARAAGSISARDLRDRLGRIYGEASNSANPVLRARAVALYGDATELVAGGESGSLDADLAAMNQECGTAG
jgi:hypothetical protein